MIVIAPIAALAIAGTAQPCSMQAFRAVSVAGPSGRHSTKGTKEWFLDGKRYTCSVPIRLLAAFRGLLISTKGNYLVAVGGQLHKVRGFGSTIQVPVLYKADGRRLTQIWKAPFIVEDTTSATAQDLDRGGVPELIIQSVGGSWMPAWILRVQSDWTVLTLYSGSISRITDVDADGICEVLSTVSREQVWNEAWFRPFQTEQLKQQSYLTVVYKLMGGQFRPWRIEPGQVHYECIESPLSLAPGIAYAVRWS